MQMSPQSHTKACNIHANLLEDAVSLSHFALPRCEMYMYVLYDGLVKAVVIKSGLEDECCIKGDRVGGQCGWRSQTQDTKFACATNCQSCIFIIARQDKI